jgi:hypothetical protein
MKMRVGFVSNSSSSSYLIKKAHLLQCQIEMIKQHSEFAELCKPTSPHNCNGESLLDYSEEVWVVTENDDEIFMGTYMDNFDMHWYLVNIVHVNPDHIEYKGSYW